MLKKTIPFFIITASFLLIIVSLSLFTKAAPQPSNTSEELQAQKQLIISYIESGDLVSAQAEFDNLISNFGGTAEIVPAVYDIAEKYRHTQNFQTSIDTYKFILDNYPDSKQAIWAQTFTAVDYVALSDMQNAQAEMEKLLKEYDGDPNLSATITEIGGAYHWFGKYSQADATNELVLQRWPDSKPALWAGMNLITSKIATGELAEASAGIEQFLIEHSGDERLPEAIFYIAGRYTWDKKYNEAQDIYYYIADHFSESEWAKNAEFESTKVAIYPLIEANDEPNALAAMDDLIVTYADKPELPSVIYDFASRIDYQNNYKPSELARRIFKKVLENFPNSKQARFAKMSIQRSDIISYINTNNVEPNENMIEDFISRYKNENQITEQLFRIARQYSQKADEYKMDGLNVEYLKYLTKAISIYEKIIREMPISQTFTTEAYYAAALDSEKIKDYWKAIEYYQRLVDDWPDDIYSPIALYKIGICFEKLGDMGIVNSKETKEQIETFYRTLFEMYPNSNLIGRTAYKLGLLNFEKENWIESAYFFEEHINKTNNNYSLREVVYYLGETYKKMGQFDRAEKIYIKFINGADPNDPRNKRVQVWLRNLKNK